MKTKILFVVLIVALVGCKKQPTYGLSDKLIDHPYTPEEISTALYTYEGNPLYRGVPYRKTALKEFARLGELTANLEKCGATAFQLQPLVRRHTLGRIRFNAAQSDAETPLSIKQELANIDELDNAYSEGYLRAKESPASCKEDFTWATEHYLDSEAYARLKPPTKEYFLKVSQELGEIKGRLEFCKAPVAIVVSSENWAKALFDNVRGLKHSWQIPPEIQQAFPDLAEVETSFQTGYQRAINSDIPLETCPVVVAKETDKVIEGRFTVGGMQAAAHAALRLSVLPLEPNLEHPDKIIVKLEHPENPDSFTIKQEK